MAYQFFAKAHQSNKAPTSPPLSPPPSSPSPRHSRPPMQPPSLVLPQSSGSSAAPNIASRLKPPAARNPSFQPPAYPHAISPGYQTPHPHITIDPVSTAHIPSLTRITGLLLPIRYPNSFYTATITDPVIASVSRVAIYHDHPVAAAPSTTPSPAAPSLGASTGTDKVIGGIRCRLERLPATAVEAGTSPHSQKPEPTNLYIQTLHLLSPYRGCGVATSLLNSILFASPPSSSLSSSSSFASNSVSELVKHYNIRTVTAHVHEANEEGLRWYIARGFQVEEGLVENYYRRLKPSGAKIVKLTLQWSDDSGDSDGTPQDISEQTLPVQNAKGEEEDDDWEKVEAEDSDDPDAHGVQPFTDSRILEVDECPPRKRKADDEPQRH